MKNLILVIFLINFNNSVFSQETRPIADPKLQTGWYFVVKNNGTGVKRQLDKDSISHFIDPNPIVTVKNFTELKIYKSRWGDIGLSIQLDSLGTIAWSIATKRAVGLPLALIVDDKLIHVPIVNSQITGGITALNRQSAYSRKELLRFKKIIEKEKSHKFKPIINEAW